MSFDPTNAVIIGLSVAVILLAIDAILIRRRIRKILRGKNGACIDDSIVSLDKDVRSL